MNTLKYMQLLNAQRLLDDGGGVTGISADLSAADQLMSGLRGPLGTLLGVLTWIMIVGIVIYTAFEVMYIVFPIMQTAISGEGKSGKGLDKMVSGDARRAVEIGNRGEENPLVFYLKHRIIVYVVLGVLIALLITGNAFKLIQAGADVGQGAIDVIENVSGNSTGFTPIEPQ